MGKPLILKGFWNVRRLKKYRQKKLKIGRECGKSKKILLFPNFYLPIEIVKKTNIEYKKISKTFTEEELIEIATEKLEIEIEAEIENKDNIINKQINVDKQEEYVEVEIIYEVIEKIGIEEKIIL